MKTGWKAWASTASLVVAAAALAACGSSSSSSSSSSAAASTGASSGGASPTTLTVSSDLPLQGASADASRDTVNAIKLLLQQQNNMAGKYKIVYKSYDNSTAAAGAWDAATCTKNANDHVNNNEVAVMGTYNSGCAKLEVPILNKAPNGPLLMVSHANTNPGLTKPWNPGEPDIYYPTGKRNYGRIIATDDFQGTADAQFAAQVLKVKRCYVLNDTQTYGVGVARAFVTAAKANGITVLANVGWDAKQPNYVALFTAAKAQNPDCVYLGGIEDNNGGQVVKDKVKVLGPNNGAVKLIGPDGFTGYPSFQKLGQAQGMYLSFAGLPISVLAKTAGKASSFMSAFQTTYGHPPASNYSVYGAAAMQIILAAIAKSDGTRAGINSQVFTAPGITIPASDAVIGKSFGVDPVGGDVTVRDMSIELMANNNEQFLRPWKVQ